MPTQVLAFLAVFVYATHATQAIAFEWKPGFNTVVYYHVAITRVFSYSSSDDDLFSSLIAVFTLLV